MMSDAEVREELIRLRKQVEALSEARKHQRAKAQTEARVADAAADSDEDEPNLRKQVEELIKLAQEEIREMPAMPTLAVFLLGVLVGRYLR
jgi:hypothetical protein